MKIGIIGAGNVGAGLATRLFGGDHELQLSASTLGSPRLAELSRRTGAAAGSAEDVATWAEVVVVAVPYSAVHELLTPGFADACRGTVVVDATNPLAADFMSLTVGHTSSGAEQIAAALPHASVIKAFNTVFADTLGDPVLGGLRQVLPVAGNDVQAKGLVLDLGRGLGFDAVDAGPLSNARYLEPAVELLIQLAYGQQLGTGIGWALARR